MEIKESLKKFWRFLKKDSWPSLIVVLIIAFILIKLVFFPLLSWATGTSLPLVIVESCSMYHSANLEDVLKNPIYSQYGINYGDASDWGFKNGLSKGDIIFVIGAKNLKDGDVIIFNGGTQHPIIHRIIKIDINGITTKGDHNSALLPQEQNIKDNQLIGKAVFRIPLLGWVKLIFFEFSRSASERGLCS